MPPAGATVVDAADRWVLVRAAVDPWTAADWGLPADVVHPDLSPEGLEARVALDRAALAALDGVAPATEVEADAAALLRAVAGGAVALHDLGEDVRAMLRPTLDGPVATLRRAVDQAPDAASATAAAAAIGPAVSQLVSTLRAAAAAGVVFGRRALDGAARAADAAAVAVARWGAGPASHLAGLGVTIREELLPVAGDDACGRDAWRAWARRWCGTDVDPDEARSWAADALETALVERDALLATLDRWPSRVVVTGDEDRLAAAREVVAEAVAAGGALGVPVGDVDVRLAPPGSTGVPWYAPPALDGSTAATVWLPTERDAGPFDAADVTGIHHEAVPGHHLETSAARGNAELTVLQRCVTLPAWSEGWAVEAQELAGPLGLLDDPRRRVAAVGSVALRLAWVVLDVDLHCGRVDPDERAEQLASMLGLPRRSCDVLVERILVRPAHAAAYGLGLRAWRDVITKSGVDGAVAALRRGPVPLDRIP